MMEKIISAIGMSNANAYTAYGAYDVAKHNAEDKPPLTEEELLKYTQDS